MAEAKAKKTESAKKIVDVKSDGDGATGTSRPVIVTNRPIMKDPMMAEVSQLTGGTLDDSPATVAADDAPKEPVSGPPELKVPAKKLAIKITDEAETADDKSDTPPTPAPTKKKVVIKPLSEPTTDKPATKASKKAPTIAELALPDAEEVPDVTVEPAKPEDGAEQPATDSNTPAGADKESPAAASESDNEKPAEEVSAEPSVDDEVVTGVQPGRSFDETVSTTPDAEAPPEPEEVELDARGKPKSKPKKTSELTSEQQKAIEKGEYFLPITTAETRRMRREIVLATLLIIVLIVVWLDIMLDAGIISIGGVNAFTDLL
jgi:hypothetical protein